MRYIIEEALHEIFWENDTPLPVGMRVLKNRLIKGTVSQEKKEEILKKNGFVLQHPAIYKKVKK